MSFHVIEELPQEDQAELTRILAIPVTQRSAREAAYLAARADYLDNRIIAEDEDGNISVASGLIVPVDGQPGFAKGAFFKERDALNGVAAVYQNVGTTTSCDFRLINSSTSGGGGNRFYVQVGYDETDNYPVTVGSVTADVQINQAMTDINANGGGEVMVAPGTFTISDIIQLPSSVHLKGYGMEVTTIKAVNSYNPATDGPGGSTERCMLMAAAGSIANVEVSGMTFDGNVTNIVGAGFSQQIDIRHVTNMRFHHNRVTKGINWAVFMTGDQIWINDNVVLGGYSSSYNQNDGIHLRAATNFFIQNNYIDTTAGGGNGGDDAIALVSDSNNTEDLAHGLVSGNIIAGSGSRGIIGDIASAYNIRDVAIVNNVISDTVNAGIKLYSVNSQTGKYLGITIANNTFDNIGTTGADGGDIIRLDKDYGTARALYENILITGNEFRSQNAASTTWYGINMLGGGNDITITSNSFDGIVGLGGIKLGSSSNPVTDYVIAGNKINVSNGASNVIGIHLYRSSRGTVATNNIYGHTTGTTYAIYVEGVSSGDANYNNISHNNIYTFDNGIAEINSGAAPDNNQYLFNVFQTVTTRYTLLGTASSFMEMNKTTGKVGVGIVSPDGQLDVASLTDPVSSLSSSAVYQLMLRYNAATDNKSAGLAFGVTNGAATAGAAIWHTRKGSNSYGDLSLGTRISGGNVIERLTLTAAGNVILGNQAALATNATDGFAYLTSGAGVPTGAPTGYTGKVAFYYDTTNNKLYIYNGAWKSVTLA